MNATENFVRILDGQIPQRVPVLTFAMEPARVWYNMPTVLLELPPDINKAAQKSNDPNIQAVLDKAGEVATFVVGIGHPAESLLTGMNLCIESQKINSGNPDYYIWQNTLETPKGILKCSCLLSDKQFPPYEKERLLKTPQDIEKLLSVPFQDYNIDKSWVEEKKQRFDDRFLILWNVNISPAAMLYHFAGPERFSLWTIDHRSLLLDAVEELAWRRLKLLEALAEAGAGPVFHCGGVEDFIPPLQSPANLREFILPYEKKFIERVHELGGYVWLHSHGKVNRFLEDFVFIGADCTQPLEPPPMGDVILEDAKKRYGGQITLIGNIQTHDLMTADTGYIQKIVRDCMLTGKPGGRFVLAPSAEPVTTPKITDLHRDNLIAYFETGMEFGKY
jgi:hypothetical protein